MGRPDPSGRQPADGGPTALRGGPPDPRPTVGRRTGDHRPAGERRLGPAGPGERCARAGAPAQPASPCAHHRARRCRPLAPPGGPAPSQRTSRPQPEISEEAADVGLLATVVTIVRPYRHRELGQREAAATRCRCAPQRTPGRSTSLPPGCPPRLTSRAVRQSSRGGVRALGTVNVLSAARCASSQDGVAQYLLLAGRRPDPELGRSRRIAAGHTRRGSPPARRTRPGSAALGGACRERCRRGHHVRW